MNEHSNVLALFKDKRNETFARFCVYQNPVDPLKQSFIENWAIVDERNVDLYSNTVCAEIEKQGKGAPSNKNEWNRLLLSSGIPYGGFIQRISQLISYEDSLELFQNFHIYGNRGYSIKLANQSDPDWLVLQSVAMSIGRSKTYWQISILKTLFAEEKSWFDGQITFSDVETFEEPKSFKNFIRNGGAMGKPNMHFPGEGIEYAILSKVTSGETSPLSSLVPEDEVVKITGRQTALIP